MADGLLSSRLARRTWRETASLAGLLVVVFGVFMYRLGSVVISDMDEGTYLYAGKLLSQGLIPYRDFLLAHPPLLVVLAAAWETFAGSDIMAARMAYLAAVLASTIPLYFVGRRMTRSVPGGLLTVVTYTSGMLLLANMGRTIRLEPVMNAFLIGAFALYFLRSDTPRSRFAMGLLLACAVLVKLVAAVPIAFLLVGDVLWSHSGDVVWSHRARRLVSWWTPVIVGGAAILIPAGLLLVVQPHFLTDVFVSQVARPGLPLGLRIEYLVQDLERFPPIAIALLTALWLIVRGRDAQTRVVSLVSLGGTLALVCLFRTFFGYYLVQLLPWLAVLFSIAFVAVLKRVTPGRIALIMGAAVVVLGAAVPLAYEEYYNRTAHEHVSSPAAIVPLLAAGHGPMYAMYPSFALWANRPEVPWYYAADSLIPRLTGDLHDAELIQAFSASESVVLFEGELTDYPQAETYLKSNFTPRYQDSDYSLWQRN